MDRRLSADAARSAKGEGVAVIRRCAPASGFAASGFPASGFPASGLAASGKKVVRSPSMPESLAPSVSFAMMKTAPVPSRSSILAVIATSMRTGDASLPQAARRLGVSTRTLQRRLTAAGTSFSELVAEVRLDTACHLLAESDLSLAAIATRLGYTGPSSFSRSFRRLMKIQPAVYRRQHAAGLRGERHENASKQ